VDARFVSTTRFIDIFDDKILLEVSIFAKHNKFDCKQSLVEMGHCCVFCNILHNEILLKCDVEKLSKIFLVVYV